MTDNAQKTPLGRTLSRFAQQKALDEIGKRGRALPCSVDSVNGSIVTVNFEVTGLALPKVTMPLFGSEYVRLPIQKGCLGVTVPVDTYTGGVTGLGGGTADTSLRANLSTLVFVPVGNTNWTAPPGSDANTLALYGKLALLLLDSLAGNSSVKLTSSGITMTFGSATITLNSSGITLAVGSHSIVINSSGVTIDGKVFLTHAHGGVQAGGSNTGPVV